MGLFNFLNKGKRESISDKKFYSEQYQKEVRALTLTVLEENNHQRHFAETELKNQGLNRAQINFVIEQVYKRIQEANKTSVHTEKKTSPTFEFGISDELIEEILNNNVSEEKAKDYLDKLISFGIHQINAGNTENAKELFEKSIIINPDSDTAYSCLSTLNYNLGNYNDSIVQVNKAISLNSNNIHYYLNKAITCEYIEDFSEAKKCYLQALELEPKNINALNALVVAHMRDNEFNDALVVVNTLLQHSEDVTLIHGPRLNKIGILMELEQEDLAHELYSTMIAQFPQDLSIHHIIPNFYYFKGFKDKAEHFFNEQRDQTKDIIYLKYKAEFLQIRDKKKALIAFEEYLDYNPDDTIALDAKLTLGLELNKNIDIEKETENILNIDPNNINALYQKSKELFFNHQYPEALALAEKIYSLNNTNMQSVGLMIDIHVKFHTSTTTDEYIEQLKKENEGQAYNIDFRKGLYLKGLEKYEPAIEIFNHLNKELEFAWNYYQLGIIKNLQGKTKESLELLAKTFELDPELKADAREYHELKNLNKDPRFISLVQ